MTTLPTTIVGDAYTVSRHWDLLCDLVDLDNRMAGQDGEAEGAELVKEAFEANGLRDATVTEFGIPGWWRDSSGLRPWNTTARTSSMPSTRPWPFPELRAATWRPNWSTSATAAAPRFRRSGHRGETRHGVKHDPRGRLRALDSPRGEVRGGGPRRRGRVPLPQSLGRKSPADRKTSGRRTVPVIFPPSASRRRSATVSSGTAVAARRRPDFTVELPKRTDELPQHRSRRRPRHGRRGTRHRARRRSRRR